MTRQVLISISGLQFEVDAEEAVEVISVGEYFYRNNKHYILYEDMLEDGGDSGEITKNTMKIAEDQVEILKKGANNVNMVFKENQKTVTYYNTPFGNLVVGIHTTKVEIAEQENSLLVNIDYGLDVNYNHVSDCHITIHVSSRGRTEN